MSLLDIGPQDKHCFVYCGDNRCNCYKSPRYRNHPAVRERREKHVEAARRILDELKATSDGSGVDYTTITRDTSNG